METSDFNPDRQNNRDWIRLNVGGRRFLTCRSTVQSRAPESMLARMMAAQDAGMRPGYRDHQGAVLIDRSPRYFEPILNYLRTGKIILDDGVNPEGKN